MRLTNGIMAFALAAGLGMGVSSASAQFTVSDPGPINSQAAAGDATNGVLSYVYSGPDFFASGITLSGTLTSAYSGTYASEACVRVIAPDASYRDITSGFTSTHGYTSLNVSNVLRGWSPNISGTAGTWQFRFFESYVDNSSGPDSTWTNVSITANAYIPPAPPAGAIDLGHLTAGGMLMSQNAYAANTVQWYKFTLDSPIASGDLFRAHTFGNTLTGGQYGDSDTEIALFDSTGAVIGNNDDAGFPQLWSDIQNTGGLAAGDYWIAASAYNLSYGDGWTASASDAGAPAGDLKITITPAPASVGLLGLGGLVAMRRRRNG